ncbi:MAG: tRNA-binding protein [Flavobacteriales bacterium]|nr:tRNA-binding protein [Flavobacteriales bacterium]NNK80164.1 tRNA-binding protein [Flavobacteriales bacterium]
MDNLTWREFEKIEMRAGTIVDAQPFPQAKRAAYKLLIDFGEFGFKKSSAQITDQYELEDLIGKQVVAVCNFPPKQIADFMSECLILGLIGGNEGVVLLRPDKPVENGQRVA